MAREPRIGVVIWLILLLGLVTTALGVVFGVAGAPNGTSGVIGAVISSLGAGIVGAALSIVVARATDRAGIHEISAMLSRSLNARLLSSAEDLQMIRGDWHHYHLTSVDGQVVWRYSRHRLDGAVLSNSLHTQIDVLDSLGEPYRYNVEAGVLGSKGILLLQGARGEANSEAVEVFPGMTRAFHPVHFGIGVFETWDNRNFVAKIILSRRALVSMSKAGEIDPDQFAELDRIWDKGFASNHLIFPSSGPAE